MCGTTSACGRGGDSAWVWVARPAVDGELRLGVGPFNGVRREMKDDEMLGRRTV